MLHNSVVVRSTDYRGQLSKFKIWLYHLITKQICMLGEIISPLCASVSQYVKIGIIMVFTS